MSYIKFKAQANGATPNAMRVYYGQVLHLLKVDVKNPDREPTTSLLALIRVSDVQAESVLGDGCFTALKVTQREFRGQTVIDATNILGVAARVRDRGVSYFVERPGSLDFFQNTMQLEEVGDNEV